MKEKLIRFFGSLHIHFFLIIFLAAMIPASLITTGFVRLYENRQIQTDYSQITSQAKLITNQIATTGYLNDPSAVDFLNAELTAMANAYGGRMMVINNSLQVVKDTYSAEEGKSVVWSNVVKASRGTTSYYVDQESNYIIVTIPIPNMTYSDSDKTSDSNSLVSSNDSDSDSSLRTKEEGPYLGVLLIMKSTDDISQNITFLQDVMWEVLLVVFIFAVVTAAFFSDRMTRPLRKIRDLIPHIQDHAEETLPTKGYTEVRDIAEHFNTFKEKMQDIDDSRAEFVSNVSHELKTPLASMKVLADSINSMGGEAPLEMYQEFMGDITSEIDRETSIINDLLSLVKLDKSGVSLNIQSLNMNELLENLLKRLRPLAEKQGVELVLESFRPIVCDVDEVKFTLAIMNLVENGIKYNHEGGWVHVTLNSDHEYCFIKVKDSGMGIPEDSLDRIFERFYRVNKSHSREIGGTGLGLAITWNSIMLHHGEIKVASILDQGTTFDVRIPLKYIQEGDEK
jgi:signal transduction histidine kinase